MGNISPIIRSDVTQALRFYDFADLAEKCTVVQLWCSLCIDLTTKIAISSLSPLNVCVSRFEILLLKSGLGASSLGLFKTH